MPLEIVNMDITRMSVDAIVNAANSSLLGGGGVDGAIHRAAGPRLLAECRTLGGCEVGAAKITLGYDLPAKHVIHTVGPVWRGGDHQEAELLAACYRESLQLAIQHELESIAFPLISTGIYGYPIDRAIRIAIAEIEQCLKSAELKVYLVVFDMTSFSLPATLRSELRKFLEDEYLPEPVISDLSEDAGNFSFRSVLSSPMSVAKARKLSDLFAGLEETFSQMLLRLIDEKGMTDAETYKRANIDRRLFSKIRNDIHYKPSKSTVLAFAVALRLNLDETKDLLLKAGYALSNSSKFDLIIRYFIEQNIHNIFEINEALFAFEQPQLGS